MHEFDDSGEGGDVRVAPDALRMRLGLAVGWEDMMGGYGGMRTRSSGEIRPSGSTAEASTQIAPAPLVAKPYAACHE